jgi:MarC family membrane protein
MSLSFWTVAVTLFFTLNPIGNLPLFIALLKGYPTQRQAIIVVRELCFALALMLLFAFFGRTILAALGLREEVISIGGGVILFLIAIRLVFPHHVTPSQVVTRHHEPFLVPLATPIMAGGGTLATAMMYGLQPIEPLVLLGALVVSWAANGLILCLAPLMSRYLAEPVLMAIERLMGLVLTLIAVQMMLSGTVQFVTSLPNAKIVEDAR